MYSIKLLIKSLFGTLVFLAILFVAAGRLTYWQGWMYAALNLLMVIINSLALNKRQEVAEQRLKTGTDTKPWDKLIVGISAILLIATYIVCGLDAGRFNWSGDFHRGLYATGIVLILAGEVLFFSAQKQNNFFSSLTRIQKERGHTVIDSGPYSFVRHPAYLGNILTAAGIPLILGSFWGFIPCFLSIIATVIRTYLEDKTLQEELPGYTDYTGKTKYRLLPLIW